MNKASGGCGYPVDLFQILKDDPVKLLHMICQQIWKTQQWSQNWKRSVFIPVPKKGNAKECLNYPTIALISEANKIMLKILPARLQKYVNQELPDVKTGFRKGSGFIEQSFRLGGRRRGRDVSREQHRNMYTIKGETDYRPRLDA